MGEVPELSDIQLSSALELANYLPEFYRQCDILTYMPIHAKVKQISSSSQYLDSTVHTPKVALYEQRNSSGIK
jgi:hypothetical protein